MSVGASANALTHYGGSDNKMAFLKYGLIWFDRIKELNRTELIILAYVESNKTLTTLTLDQWSTLLNVSKSTITRAIKTLTNNKLIQNKSYSNKLILGSKYHTQMTKEQENKAKELINDLLK